jgi:acetylornithine deacetylase
MININIILSGFETLVVSYGTDVPYLKGDHKRYLYGPGSILVAHSKDEYVTIQDLHDAVKGYKKLIAEALDPSSGKKLEVAEPEIQAEEVVTVHTVVVDHETQIDL